MSGFYVSVGHPIAIKLAVLGSSPDSSCVSLVVIEFSIDNLINDKSQDKHITICFVLYWAHHSYL